MAADRKKNHGPLIGYCWEILAETRISLICTCMAISWKVNCLLIGGILTERSRLLAIWNARHQTGGSLRLSTLGHRCEGWCLFIPTDGPTGIEIHPDPGDGETPVSVGAGEYIKCSGSGRPTPNYHWEKKEGDVGDETYEGQELYVRVTFYSLFCYLACVS